MLTNATRHKHLQLNLGLVQASATFAAVSAAPTAHAQTFFARGKLMLTGEYLVLDGATALAVPTTLGQRLHVTPTDDVDVLVWRSYDCQGQVWLKEQLTRRLLTSGLNKGWDSFKQPRLARMLEAALVDHPLAWPSGTGLLMESHLEFDRSWGLGSSSTLSYLLAAWTGVDAFDLNKSEFGGSAYDVACAGAEGPLLYHLAGEQLQHPRVERLQWAGPWLEQAWLVHLGQKRNSRHAIADYRHQAAGELSQYVSELDALTQNLLHVHDVAEAARLLKTHEALVGYVTHQTPIGRERFADFPGTIKSLGAWGGDFILALPTDAVDVKAYFARHQLATVLPATSLLLLDRPQEGTQPVSAAPPPVASTKASTTAAATAADVANEKATAGGEPVAQATPAEMTTTGWLFTDLQSDPRFWPVFINAELDAPAEERQWLVGYIWHYAELPGFAADIDPPYTPVPQAGSRLQGILIYLPPGDVVTMDLDPTFRSLRRSHATVYVGKLPVRAHVWLSVRLAA